MSSEHTLTCPVDTFTVLAGHISVFVRAQHSKMCSFNTIMSVSVTDQQLLSIMTDFSLDCQINAVPYEKGRGNNLLEDKLSMMMRGRGAGKHYFCEKK